MKSTRQEWKIVARQKTKYICMYSGNLYYTFFLCLYWLCVSSPFWRNKSAGMQNKGLPAWTTRRPVDCAINGLKLVPGKTAAQENIKHAPRWRIMFCSLYFYIKRNWAMLNYNEKIKKSSICFGIFCKRTAADLIWYINKKQNSGVQNTLRMRPVNHLKFKIIKYQLAPN